MLCVLKNSSFFRDHKDIFLCLLLVELVFLFYHLYFVFNFIFPWRNSVVSEPFKEHSVLFLWFVMWPLPYNTCPYKINLLLTFISHSLCLFACLPIVMTWTLDMLRQIFTFKRNKNILALLDPAFFFPHDFFWIQIVKFHENPFGIFKELYLISN